MLIATTAQSLALRVGPFSGGPSLTKQPISVFLEQKNAKFDTIL